MNIVGSSGGDEGWIYYVGLGANIGEPLEQLVSALAVISSLETTLGRVESSSIFRSAPWGYSDQPDFLNAVCRFQSALEPHPLLEALLEIERYLGRVRDGEKWGPRPIDLDILWSDWGELKTDSLELPHPRIAERSFVLEPLRELEPELAQSWGNTPGKATPDDEPLKLLLTREEVDTLLKSALGLDS